MNKIVFCLLLCLSSSANAGIIRSAVDTTTSSEKNASYDIGNTLDQSGLSSTYNSGFNRFDTYLASNPVHTSHAQGLEWFSQGGIQNATAEYVFGSMFTIDASALWIEKSWAPHSNVSFLVSNNSVDFTSNLGGSSLLENSGGYHATIFEFSSDNARYFQIDFVSCSALGCSLGEITLSKESVSKVSAPTGFWVLGSGLIGFIGMRKKASQVSEVL